MRTITKAITDHPVLSSGAGFLIGYHAAAGSLFAALLAAGSIGAYASAKRMAAAKEAARAAAITTASTAPECVADLKSPACVERAKAAAIKAGQDVLAGKGELGLPKKVLAALAIIAVVVVILGHLH